MYGDYFRLLTPKEYVISVSSPGFKRLSKRVSVPKGVTNPVTGLYSAKVVNFTLEEDHILVSYYIYILMYDSNK